MRRWMRRMWIGAGVVAAVYGALVAGVGLGYRTFLYPKRPPREPDLPVAGVSLVRIEGTAIVYALSAPAPEGAPTFVTFHGNGEQIADELPMVRTLHDLGVGVLAVEYPGYGLAHEQSADEGAIYAAASQAFDWLEREGVPPERTVVMGFSLGSGPAVEMASRGRAAAIVLLAPYTSMPDMVSRFMPIVPTRLLVGDAFDNLAKAPRIEVPALVIHGDEDGIIPVRMGERVASAFPRGELHVVRGGHHNDLAAHDPGLFGRIVDFAREHAR